MSAAGAPLLARVGRVVWPLALVLLGALVLASAWQGWVVSLLFALAAGVPLLALRGALRVGMSRWFATSMLVLLAVMGAYLATSGAGLSLEATVRDAVPRLLTAPLPYAAAPDLLVGPLLLTALVSLLVGLRVDSRLRVEPVAGAAVLYLAGVLLTAGAADPIGLVAVLLLVVALLGWVLLDEHGEPVRRRLSVTGPVAVVGVGLVAAAATLPVAGAFQPRELVTPPTTEVAAANPLTQLGAWANNPDEVLLRVRGPAVPLRLVVLEDYDGTQWTSATTYRSLRSDGTTGLDPGRYRSDATVQVQLDGLGGSWLPSPGLPLEVGRDGTLVDPRTGTLFSPDDTAGAVYEVAGAFDAPPDDALDGARLPDQTTRDTERWTALPPLPEPLADFARRVGERGATPYQRASAIEALVRDEYDQSATAISGSALWRLDRFLLRGTDTPGGGVGTSEQFASAFAVLARYNGLPTRVVVGFRPGQPTDDGVRLVRGQDAFAWAEVYFDDLGWVPFSPTPDDDTFARSGAVEATQDELPEPADTGSPQPEVPTDDATAAPEGDDEAAAPPRAGGSGSMPTGVLVGALLGLALLALVALRAARQLRHGRRGAPGAWAEVVDALRLAGLRPAGHEPADLVAARLDARLGTRSALVAARAERSAFGPADDPASEADRAALRGEVRAVRSRLRRELPWWRRWTWWLDPRVLRR
ncbi:transglutaminaseTgpA domain-containing protein [Nocardioides litoris]|uniref:transglutaminase family protein n=1 Tax=Nocardioides litoris TaxID=1926648 RepID=UPI0014774E93|nr:transglutaminase domain-containing protein [Nocardioides litoris]